MSFSIERQDNYAIISAQVEKLDAVIAPELKAELIVLNKDEVRNIIIDLSEVKYCDSSGLSALLIGNRVCKEANGSFIISTVQPTVMKLITISQLESILKKAYVLNILVSNKLTSNAVKNLVNMDYSQRHMQMVFNPNITNDTKIVFTILRALSKKFKKHRKTIYAGCQKKHKKPFGDVNTKLKEMDKTIDILSKLAEIYESKYKRGIK